MASNKSLCYFFRFEFCTEDIEKKGKHKKRSLKVAVDNKTNFSVQFCTAS